MNRIATESLRIAFVVGGFYTEGSGVARAIASLSKHLAEDGHTVTVFAPSYPGKPDATDLLDSKVEYVSAPGHWCFRLGVSPKLRRVLSKRLCTFDVVHTHSLWMLPTHYATAIAARDKLPAVASVHGFLDPWAIRYSGWKKAIASAVFQRSDLRRASVIHALTQAERGHIANYSGASHVAVIPNGISAESIAIFGNRDGFFMQCPELADSRIMLFMSRLHVKKGLDILIDAWAQISKQANDWKLAIVGPDDGYGSVVRAMIAERKLTDCVSVLPACYGQAKYDALAAADCFVLPSRSEGLPMALLEAMAAGNPVVYTTGCYFPEAAACGAGYETDSNASALAAVLLRITGSSPETLAEMGARGRELVRRDYLWPRVAQKFVELYRWVVAGKPAPPPDTVCAM